MSAEPLRTAVRRRWRRPIRVAAVLRARPSGRAAPAAARASPAPLARGARAAPAAHGQRESISLRFDSRDYV